jgi:hypothetical protein
MPATCGSQEMSGLAELRPGTGWGRGGDMNNKYWRVAGVMLELVQLVVMLVQRGC